MSSKCIAVAAVCRVAFGRAELGCSRLTKPAHSPPPHRLVTVSAVTYNLIE